MITENPVVDEINNKFQFMNTRKKLDILVDENGLTQGPVGSISAEDSSGEQTGIVHYAGDVAFINSQISGLLDDLNEKAILINEMKGMLMFPTMRLYSMLTSAELSRYDMSDQIVADFGAADGVQSLLASKLGAKAVHAVEQDSLTYGMGRYFEEHKKLNELDNISYVVSEVENKHLDELVPLDEVTLVVANLGPHYNNTHLRIFKQFDKMPNLQTIIFGGYTFSDGGKKHIYNADETLKKISKSGFEVDSYLIMKEFGRGIGRPMAFSAIKK